MKVTGPCEVKIIRNKKVIWMRPAKEDYPAWENLFDYKERRDKKDKTNIFPKVTFLIEAKERTYDQIKTVFKLLRIILITQEGREPTEDEVDEAYDDLLEMYADRRPCRFDKDKLVPIHLSKSDVYQASRLVQGAIDYLVNMCDLKSENNHFITTNLQADVREIIYRWQAWRGTLEKDPVDYIDYEKGLYITEQEWKKRHPVCEACGLAGTDVDPLQKCHIISRGADTIEEPFNWMMMHFSHHLFIQHNNGWGPLLDIYTQLIGKYNRARELAGKRGLYDS